tara:strand:- start:305 stop:529 length:225 start_codon:yes stop_codon:yes gene_type:complete
VAEMKYIYIVILTVCFGVVFGRVSNKHAVNTSPYDLAYGGQKGEISNFNGSEDDLRWKRRHKKRKKTRRPQRGR